VMDSETDSDSDAETDSVTEVVMDSETETDSEGVWELEHEDEAVVLSLAEVDGEVDSEDEMVGVSEAEGEAEGEEVVDGEAEEEVELEAEVEAEPEKEAESETEEEDEGDFDTLGDTDPENEYVDAMYRALAAAYQIVPSYTYEPSGSGPMAPINPIVHEVAAFAATRPAVRMSTRSYLNVTCVPLFNSSASCTRPSLGLATDGVTISTRDPPPTGSYENTN